MKQALVLYHILPFNVTLQTFQTLCFIDLNDVVFVLNLRDLIHNVVANLMCEEYPCENSSTELISSTEMCGSTNGLAPGPCNFGHGSRG